jgi:hypothetical protein
MFGERKMVRAGYAWHIFAKFPCNSGGVRIAIRKSSYGAERFAVKFSEQNNVATWLRVRLIR